MRADKLYEVVKPIGKSLSEVISPADPAPGLEGKKIALIWTIFNNGDVLADALIDLLGKRLKGIETVKLPAGKGVVWGGYPDESIGEVVSEARVDAAIVLVGG